MFFSIDTVLSFISCSYLILNILKPQKQCNARPNSSTVKAKPFLHWFLDEFVEDYVILNKTRREAVRIIKELGMSDKIFDFSAIVNHVWLGKVEKAQRAVQQTETRHRRFKA